MMINSMSVVLEVMDNWRDIHNNLSIDLFHRSEYWVSSKPSEPQMVEKH